MPGRIKPARKPKPGRGHENHTGIVIHMDTHEQLRALSFLRNQSMVALIREAVAGQFKEDLDELRDKGLLKETK